MPTYWYTGNMNDDKASQIIRNAFPKWPFPRKTNTKWMSVHSLCDAMLYARVKCRSESVEKCIEWAYKMK